MADKATRLPQLQAVPGEAASEETLRQLEQVSASVGAANKKKAKIEARKSNVPDEVYQRNWDLIKAADVRVKTIEKELKQAKGERGACWSVAKDEGCNIASMKRVFNEEKLDADEFDLDMKQAARIARIVGSPLAETSFMRLLDDADRVNYFTQGFTAGKAGDAITTCPHDAGSEEAEKWGRGWAEGQARLQQELLAKPPKPAKEKKPKAGKAALN